MSFKFASGRKISMPETTEHSPDAGKTIGAAHSSGRPKIDIEIYGKYAIADGMQALKVVRSHAIEWGIDPNKVGFIGFSAGAIIAARALLSEVAEDRPNFVALIYGAPLNVGVGLPAGLPPVFLAWAQDDLLAGPSVLRLHDALRASGNYPEVHIFSGGGHGFGMRKSGPSGDNWIEILYDWLKAQGFAKPIVKWDMD
jgi:acetyl esterase/lipase